MRRCYRIGAMFLAALALTGCGRTADQAAIRATVLAFLDAYASGDAETACTLLTTRGRRTLFRSRSVTDCKRTVRAQLNYVRPRRLRVIRTATIRKIFFDGTTRAHAYVDFRKEFNAPGAALRLVKRGDQWFIDGPPPGY